ncbi:hypothetical protein LTS13_010320 [Exophiala xenobiotica]|nr:hypothetical protein LTS13_010320 [Exophiala xenobiotica]KAK5398876.1 hypothetical protein LTR79_003874 [Exophiala xenobiotica]KAK5421528.1 hypothetical protein LTR90_003018 [Exophiala xenobiotica]KAK5478758.1 hypothetical protein LTR83_010738 [Exophiala xenobiotica]KAK5487012.1 hypothetical protein LTR26_005046 [Exophiala xenobiotica]
MVRATNPSVTKTGGSKGRVLVVMHYARKLFDLFHSGLSAALAWIAHSARRLWWGVEVEEPKVIIHPARFWWKLRKCAIHFLPVAATVVVTGLNIGTYFVGAEFRGNDTGYWQDFDKLALQVTAKLYELLTIASLGSIMMDILRYQLLLSSSGLPLGILAAKRLFVDTSYLFSPEFRYGISGIDKKKTRAFLALFISMCSMLALLVGPSSALLFIPQTCDSWSAGGAIFHLVGTNASIWPSQLDARSTGGANCRSPSESDLSLQLLNESSCIWSGYKAISQWFQSAHQGDNSVSILLQDGVGERNILLRYYSLSAAAFGVTAAPCLYAKMLSGVWLAAIINANLIDQKFDKSRNLAYRAKGGSTSSMDSTLPVVRTTCLTNDTVTFADVANETYYPLQFEYPTEYLASLKAKGQPYDSSTVLGRQYSFNGTTYANSPRFVAIWLETPADEPIGTQISGDSVTGRSSAYLNVQMPHPNSSTDGFHAACSIDARWVQSRILGPPVGQTGGDVTYQAPYFSVHNPDVFPATNDGNWRTVRLKTDWLNTLTPDLGGSDNWNTLASILSVTGLDNSTGLVYDLSEVGTMVAAVVSAVVADGMSRSGYEMNGGAARNTHTAGVLKHWPGGESWAPIITDKYELPMSLYYDENITERTKIHWSMTVTGLGFRAEGTAYKLALVVLLFYLVLALAHSVWVFTRLEKKQHRELSTAWSSLTELITLALKSTPPQSTLINASAGVERFRTFEEPIRIRTIGVQAASTESSPQAARQAMNELEMIVGTDYLPNEHKTVLLGLSY